MTQVIEVTTEEGLKEIRELIDLARRFALKHFNFDGRNETRLVDENLNMFRPSFFVEFPAPDEMLVSPSIMGNPASLWIEYRLHFNPLVWWGKHPLKDQYFSMLKVKGDF